MAAALGGLPGCGDDDCEIPLMIYLQVEVVDGDGSALAPGDFAARFADAKITRCTEARDDDCFDMSPDHPDITASDSFLTVTLSETAFKKRPLRCEFPVLRLSIDMPGCDPAEYVSPGGNTDDSERQLDASLKVVCPDP